MTAVLDLPGFAKSDVSIAVQPGKLIVSAERQSSASSATPSDKGKERAPDEQPEPAFAPVQWSVRERQTEVKWVRELPLAAGVKVRCARASRPLSLSQTSVLTLASHHLLQPSEIKASMADGVLTITYPKQATVDEDQRVHIE